MGTVKFPDDLDGFTMYQNEGSWLSYSVSEQAILRKTIRHFSKALREAGFLPDPKYEEEVDRGV